LKVGGSTLRAEMAGQLASNPNAPPHTIRGLAYDPAPNIAGPVLKQSRSLPDVTIAEMARCKDEDHLVAIAARANLDSHITGILTRRGSVRVLSVLASNRTASFSEQGIQRLRKFRREQRSAISRPSGRHTAH
jgi:uncharacterized protein (DUF2336 family)